MEWIGVDPRMNVVSANPQFRDLVRRIGVPAGVKPAPLQR